MGIAGRVVSRAPKVALAMLCATGLLAVLALGVGRAAPGGENPSSHQGEPASGEQPAAFPSTTYSGTGTAIDALALESLHLFALDDEGAIEEPLPATLPPDERRAAAKDGRFALPLKAWTIFTDRYGAPRGKGWIHGGLDLSLETYPASEVYSSCAGAVVTATYSRSYGNHVIVDCGEGWSTLYGHLSSILVEERQPVTFDTVLGISGSTGFSTGEHLHFEIRWEGVPVNPEDYLDFGIPEDAPLSNGPLWWGDPGPRARTAPASPAATSGGGASSDPRAAVQPTATRPAATATPTRPPATPTRPATPTPKPDR